MRYETDGLSDLGEDLLKEEGVDLRLLSALKTPSWSLNLHVKFGKLPLLVKRGLRSTMHTCQGM
jgi:hypothetical protein